MYISKYILVVKLVLYLDKTVMFPSGNSTGKFQYERKRKGLDTVGEQIRDVEIKTTKFLQYIYLSISYLVKL